MAELDYDYLARLVRYTLDGESESFAELYAATYAKQYTFACQYIKDPIAAQDVLQDIYIIVLNKLDTLKDPRLFVPWLNQITFRVCYDYKEKESRQSIPVEDVDSVNGKIIASESKSPEKIILDKYEQTELTSKILELKPQESRAIIMRYYNDMTISEIALAMDCSKSTVKRKIAAGKNTLIKKIKNLDWGGVFGD